MNSAFPTEDTAKGAVRVWSLARRIKVAMLTAAPAFVGTEATSGVGMSATGPLRARFEEHADAIWFIVRSNFGSTVSQVPDALLIFSNGVEGNHVVFRGKLSPNNDRAVLKHFGTRMRMSPFPEVQLIWMRRFSNSSQRSQRIGNETTFSASLSILLKRKLPVSRKMC
jgi:hypothetical protein